MKLPVSKWITAAALASAAVPFSAPALAQDAELVIPGEAAYAPPGDPGDGACAIARWAAPGKYLGGLDDAMELLSGPVDETRGEHRFRLREVDYTNGTIWSHGDFDVDLSMPFSAEGEPGGDGQLIAMRSIGLIRVEEAGPRTFAIRSDDGFRLRIAGSTVLEHTGLQVPRAATRVVTFEEPGRYEFELLYFENLHDAILEWSSAPGALEEVYESSTLPEGDFALIDATWLTPGEGDAMMCGTSCVPCGGATPLCEDGVCVVDPSSGAGGSGGGGEGGSASSESGGYGAEGNWMPGSGGEDGSSDDGSSDGGIDYDDPTLWGSSMCSASAAVPGGSSIGWLLAALAACGLRRRRSTSP